MKYINVIIRIIIIVPCIIINMIVLYALFSAALLVNYESAKRDLQSIPQYLNDFWQWAFKVLDNN